MHIFVFIRLSTAEILGGGGGSQAPLPSHEVLKIAQYSKG